ncbi:SsgA family sporulation/cell division regulator [Streptomyces sp. SCUT-3]|nr:SsgA family sporulation/cell division regulator [Streptomyces sp. DJ]QMV22542.1 SsgA family sporulation/cell division regulator [Streptomyces sp. SCUT-3]
MQSSVSTQVPMTFLVTQERSFRVLVDLLFTPQDPDAVRFQYQLPGEEPVRWVLPRRLLADGLGTPVASGPVRIEPTGIDGPAQVLFSLQGRRGTARFRSRVQPIAAFLNRTAPAAAPPGRR